MPAGNLAAVHVDDLPLAEFAFPGPLRDRLVAAILSGAKTSTSSLVFAYEHGNHPLPRVGQRSAVVDSDNRRVAVIEITEVRVVRLADVDLRHVADEGEGDESVAQWRAGHERFWHGAEARAELGDPEFTVNDDTLVLAQRFQLVHTVDVEREAVTRHRRPHRRLGVRQRRPVRSPHPNRTALPAFRCRRGWPRACDGGTARTRTCSASPMSHSSYRRSNGTSPRPNRPSPGYAASR